MALPVDPVVGLSLGRIGVGVLALTQPEEAARRFRLASGSSPQLTYMTRLFGSREIALGVVTLLARGTLRRNLVVAGIGIDVADAYAAVVGVKDGSLDTTTGAVLTGPAIGGVLAGVGSLRRAMRREKHSRKPGADD